MKYIYLILVLLMVAAYLVTMITTGVTADTLIEKREKSGDKEGKK